MSLVQLVEEDVIKVSLEATNKVDIIGELVQILIDAKKINDYNKVCDAVLAREDMGSTGLENGIAVPHAKTDAIDKLTLAIGTIPQGVDFDSVDGEPSKIFFLMLAPPNQSGPHILALSEIARLAKSKSLLNLISQATSADEIVALFQE